MRENSTTQSQRFATFAPRWNKRTFMTEMIVKKKPRVLPPRGLLIALVAQLPLMAVTLPLQPSGIEIGTGVALLLAGATLNIWAERLFRWNDVGVCPFTNVPIVVTGGPYRLTRNPMYVGLVCLNAGATFVTGVLPNLWISVALAMWLHYAFVLPEEEFLRKTFLVGDVAN